MRNQLSLDLPPAQDIPPTADFAGPGYVPELDKGRLTEHCERVLEALRSSPPEVWWTYADLARLADVPEGSCRTRVSNLKAWGHRIEFRTRPDRFREVRLIPELGKEKP